MLTDSRLVNFPLLPLVEPQINTCYPDCLPSASSTSHDNNCYKTSVWVPVRQSKRLSKVLNSKEMREKKNKEVRWMSSELRLNLNGSLQFKAWPNKVCLQVSSVKEALENEWKQPQKIWNPIGNMLTACVKHFWADFWAEGGKMDLNIAKCVQLRCLIVLMLTDVHNLITIVSEELKLQNRPKRP